MSSNQDELSFIISKVNGIDVSHLPQDEAVQMFLKASEPILIEVRRKFDAHCKHTDNDVDVDILDDINEKLDNLNVSTLLTQIPNGACTTFSTAKPKTTTIENNQLILTLVPPVKPIKTESLITTTAIAKARILSRSTQTNDDEHVFALHNSTRETTDRMIEQEHNFFEQCLAPEIDIEEITLRKSDSNERLGLTVCYSACTDNNGSGNNNGALSGSDENEICTEVYISDIQPESIADRDGRLRQGDQILQINGKDIKNKEETELLIAENNNAVTLLVSRYLYADEDDFNDPSGAELDVEEDVEEDDEDEEEIYDENNLAYENCFVTNDYMNVVDDLDKVLLAQAAQQQALLCEAQSSSAMKTLPSATPKATSSMTLNVEENNTTTIPKEASFKNKFIKDKTEQAPVTSLNGEQSVKVSLSIRDNQQISMKPEIITMTNTQINITPNVDYETEHIYETIPEDSESEPFYCSPYEGSMYMAGFRSCSSASMGALQLQQQKQRVAQWLGIKPHTIPTTIAPTTAPRHSVRSSSGCGRSLTRGTVRSAITTVTNGSSSSGGGIGFGCAGGSSSSNIAIALNDEHDNSSSAYNTGGSNNSVTPLILVLNQNNRGEMLTNNLDEEQVTTATSRCNKTQRINSPKEKITSPKNSAILFTKGERTGGFAKTLRGGTGESQTSTELSTRMLESTTTMDASQPPTQKFSPKTMYTNEANLLQTMLLQQHIFRQALTQQQQQQQYQQLQQEQLQQTHCPQFTAPNLSQYHFVSSQQEVGPANINSRKPHVITHKNANEETTMVWKVKRRQDGTRYIVRRPARNRLLRDRPMRLNTEHLHHDFTTTEEDTISEVKTGRYWSKEDRKKHIERARERRQQHLQNMNSTVMSTMRITDKTASKLQQRARSLQHQQLMQRQKQQPSNIQIPSEGFSTTKPLLQQHHQLHFSNVETSSASATNILNGTAVNANIPIDNSKSLFMPSKTEPQNAHICSSVDPQTMLSVPTNVAVMTTAPPTTAGVTSIDIICDVVAGVHSNPIQQSMQSQTTNDSTKISKLLSVTTV